MLKNAGFGLVALVLIFQMLFLYVPPLRVPALMALNYIALGVAITALAANKVAEIIHHSKLRKGTVQCEDCGWFGSGELWYRHKCCPECDSQSIESVDAFT